MFIQFDGRKRGRGRDGRIRREKLIIYCDLFGINGRVGILNHFLINRLERFLRGRGGAAGEKVEKREGKEKNQ